MEYEHEDNRNMGSGRPDGPSGREPWGRGYGEHERARRERTAAERQAERERFEQRQRSRYQARRPSQGTWYEHGAGNARAERGQRAAGSARGTGEHGGSGRVQQRPQGPRGSRPGHRSVPLQHQSYTGDVYGGYQGEGRTQRQQRTGQVPRVAQRPPQMGRTVQGAYGDYGRAPALEPRDILIRGAIVAVLLIVFVVRIATFGGCAQSSELDAQISDQQAQLAQASESNAQAQSQLDAMQSTIDSYNKLSSSTGS